MKKILFVCLGNICRSPSAEAVMSHIIKKNGMSEGIKVDSAGTSAYHEGEPADARMREAGKRRGYDLTSISRRVRPESDFSDFDLLVAMDEHNYEDLRRMAPTEDSASKVVRMCDYSSTKNIRQVPDPYYGGPNGFDVVIDILEEACQGLFETLHKQE